jgi:hypothetical protein
MAKTHPYFKFYCSEWNDGDITLEDFETQGVFIGLCSLYWSRECILPKKTVDKRFRNNLKNILTLEEEGIIKILGSGLVKISFLDEQWGNKDGRSSTSKTNGSKGGRPKKPNKPNEEPNNNLNDNLTKPNIEKSIEEKIIEEEKTKQKTENELGIFDGFRKAYPGTKNGNQTEFTNFMKKHKDWKEVLPDLKPLLDCIINQRDMAIRTGSFVPQWKNMSTWINNRCWEEEVGKADQVQTTIGKGDSWT